MALSDPLTPSEEETRIAESSAQQLASLAGQTTHQTIKLVGKGKAGDVVIPRTAFRLLVQILKQMARGKAVTVIPVDAEMTTQQAADFLGVSRPYLVRLLETGALPFRRIGTHRRVRLADVLEYKRKSDEERRQVLDQLAALSEEMGLYD